MDEQSIKKGSVLVLYDFRAKQEYIYRTNHMKEIEGASAIIEEGFKLLSEAAKNSAVSGKGIYGLDNGMKNNPDDFSIEKYVKHIQEGYTGEVVYEGGGNLLLLFRNAEAARLINKLFTIGLIKETYSLKALCSITDALLEEDNFIEARKRVYAENRRLDGSEISMRQVNTLPIVQVDNVTSLPLARRIKKPDGAQAKISEESWVKVKKYKESAESRDSGEKVLDELVTEKGQESLLAVVYIDGNNMGAKVQESLSHGTSYDFCVKEMRLFSNKINETFVEKGLSAVKNRVAELLASEKSEKNVSDYIRKVVAAGDEVTFICNARVAYEAAKAYLQNLPKSFSSCAGIAIFNSHAPFSEVYKIAEACCESAKKYMKKSGDPVLDDSCLLDFHYCQGAIDSDLDIIRAKESDGGLSRPWIVPRIYDDAEKYSEEKYITINKIEKLACELQRTGRTNVKSLAEHALKSKASFNRDLLRIQAHLKDEASQQASGSFAKGIGLGENVQKAVYDTVIVYDLWFAEREGGICHE